MSGLGLSKEEEERDGWVWLVGFRVRGSLSRAGSVEGARVCRVSRVAFSVAGVGLVLGGALRLRMEVERLLGMLALVESAEVEGSGGRTAGDGTRRLASLVLAKASRLAAASASDTATEYEGESLLPRVAPPPPGAQMGILRRARTRAHMNLDRRAARTVSLAQFD